MCSLLLGRLTVLDSSCAAGTPLFNLRLCLILLLSYGFRLALRLNTWLRDCVNLRSVFVIFDHLIGIELRSQVLLSLLPGCLSKDVTGTPRNLRSPLFGCLCLHRVSVLRRDRLTSSYLLRNFCAHTVCLSKDVTGHCSSFCIALLRSSFCFYYSDSSFPFYLSGLLLITST